MHDLHFALCTNCTSSRPTFVCEKDPNEQEIIDEDIVEDLHLKCNSIPNAPRDTVASIGREKLTIVPVNHLQRRHIC